MAASLALRLSGGVGNTDPAASLGGVMSTTALGSNNLFDEVGAAEALAGDVEYRCIFIINDGDRDVTNVRVWVSVEPASGDLIGLALDGNGINADAETESDEGTAPTGETFDDTTNPIENALAVPDLDVGDRHAVWVRRTVGASTAGINVASNPVTLRVDYEYVPA